MSFLSNKLLQISSSYCIEMGDKQDKESGKFQKGLKAKENKRMISE